ncbi:MAG: hypothetical protein ABSD20_18570 [Terriglobales bacterium]
MSAAPSVIWGESKGPVFCPHIQRCERPAPVLVHPRSSETGPIWGLDQFETTSNGTLRNGRHFSGKTIAAGTVVGSAILGYVAIFPVLLYLLFQ